MVAFYVFCLSSVISWFAVFAVPFSFLRGQSVVWKLAMQIAYFKFFAPGFLHFSSEHWSSSAIKHLRHLPVQKPSGIIQLSLAITLHKTSNVKMLVSRNFGTSLVSLSLFVSCLVKLTLIHCSLTRFLHQALHAPVGCSYPCCDESESPFPTQSDDAEPWFYLDSSP